MLDKKEFAAIREDIKKSDETRELLISQAREVVKLSKKIIYSLHRGELVEAEKDLKILAKKSKSLPACLHEHGIKSNAVQEYVEAACFYSAVKGMELPTRKELGAETEEYLMGLCDLTGELVRKAVRDIIKGNYGQATKIYELVDNIYGEFLQFDLRNGELRKKSDSIKYNLKRLEEVIYDLKIRRH